MGAYLSQPITEKISEDKTTGKLSYGASSMQGWRMSMEDAHNAILELDEETAMFGVYDGHGGSEVAIYCAQHLPEIIQNSKAYKDGDLHKALEDAFMEFDAVLTKDEVIRELKQIAGTLDEDDKDSEEAAMLAEEATLPLSDLLAKYGQQLKEHSKTKALRKKVNQEDLLSPMISKSKSKINPLINEFEGTGDTKINGQKSDTIDSADEIKNEHNDSKEKGDIESGVSETDCVTPKKCNGKSHPEISNKTVENNAGKTQNEKDAKPGGSTAENGDVDEDEDDEDYKEGQDHVEDEDENDDEAEDDDDDDDDDEDDDEEGEEDSSEEEEEATGRQRSGVFSEQEEPGSDSGCTCVVALLRGNQLIVGNAGDSRCIVSRSNKAIDLSIDHKPEDELERKRIEKAGGKVTMDGRVNGGLNMSRALGDHCYKKNSALPAKEQMISAFPDIQTLTLTPEDEFMVVACDGIWNVMSSQEVVEFVKSRLDMKDDENKPRTLSSICEEMFEHCIAPDTMGDGTGCDNMTCVIIRLNTSSPIGIDQSMIGTKRPAGEDTASPAKRTKV
ncbi:protein phosphatase 1G-like [Saccoglossus kowalevskii]|uniref:protein-serine/threonine phosphatase n=1 Tax=Saccoglossus kowalevskii TaxID=10224 RepID=A0ABM0GUS2_SACKO|nr:PREDICTED: protein phosphatase 1G-like [Saccoglossus kowalevskii]